MPSAPDITLDGAVLDSEGEQVVAWTPLDATDDGATLTATWDVPSANASGEVRVVARARSDAYRTSALASQSVQVDGCRACRARRQPERHVQSSRAVGPDDAVR